MTPIVKNYDKSMDDQVYFDPSDPADVRIIKSNWTVEGGNISGVEKVLKTIGGISYCVGVTFRVNVTTQKWMALTQDFAVQVPGYWVTVPSTVEVTVYYQSSSQAEVDGGTSEDIKEEENSTLQWVAQMVIRRDGINRKCRDTYDIEDRGRGEKRATEDIVLPMIPDQNTADKIGEIAIWKSYRNNTVDISTVPNFDLGPPGEWFTFSLTKNDKYDLVERVTGITFDDYNFIVSTEIEE